MSRRTIRTGLVTALVSGAISTAGLCTAVAEQNSASGAGAVPPRFEIMHFWNASAEQQAFEVLRDAFRRRYTVEWKEHALPTFNAVRRKALRRITNGYPPDVVQWHPSPEIWDMYDMRVINTITPLAERLELDEKLPAVVRQTVVTDGEYVGLPTNIHGENFMWFNAGIYRQLDFEYPESWEQLLDQVRVINEAGYAAVAMGEEDWEKRLMFSAILNSISPETYLALVSTGEPELAGKASVQRAYRIMATLRDASRVNPAPADWTDAAEWMVTGKAAIQFMGDWLDRELTAQGWHLGEDFECRLPPGENPSFMIVVDGFIFPVTGKNDESLQEAFAGIALQPETQIEFALKKGALPVIKGLSDPRFDRCSRIGLEALQDESRVVGSSAMFTAMSFGNVIQSVAVDLWKSRMSADEAVEMLREELIIVGDLEQLP